MENKTKIKNLSRTRAYRKIRKSLIEQMEYNGGLTDYYEDLIDDYMKFWSTKTMLIEDITERGVQVEYDNGGGQKGMKKNESVDLLLKTNAQMLKLLGELGIKPGESNFEEL